MFIELRHNIICLQKHIKQITLHSTKKNEYKSLLLGEIVP